MTVYTVLSAKDHLGLRQEALQSLFDKTNAYAQAKDTVHFAVQIEGGKVEILAIRLTGRQGELLKGRINEDTVYDREHGLNRGDPMEIWVSQVVYFHTNRH
jgi:hypothetical protein